MKLPILIDVDGVLTDGFYEKCASIINERFGTNYQIDDFYDDLRKVIPEWDEKMEEIIRSPGFCSDFLPIDGAVEWIKRIKAQGQDVKYVTSPYKNSPTWGYDRTKWLEKCFEATRDDIILCHDKRYISGLTLIDDLPKNCIDWSNFHQRKANLVCQAWNLDFRKQPLLHYLQFEHKMPRFRCNIY